MTPPLNTWHWSTSCHHLYKAITKTSHQAKAGVAFWASWGSWALVVFYVCAGGTSCAHCLVRQVHCETLGPRRLELGGKGWVSWSSTEGTGWHGPVVILSFVCWFWFCSVMIIVEAWIEKCLKCAMAWLSHNNGGFEGNIFSHWLLISKQETWCYHDNRSRKSSITTHTISIRSLHNFWCWTEIGWLGGMNRQVCFQALKIFVFLKSETSVWSKVAPWLEII